MNKFKNGLKYVLIGWAGLGILAILLYLLSVHPFFFIPILASIVMFYFGVEDTPPMKTRGPYSPKLPTPTPGQREP